jgi:hypothetical protein
MAFSHSDLATKSISALVDSGVTARYKTCTPLPIEKFFGLLLRLDSAKVTATGDQSEIGQGNGSKAEQGVGMSGAWLQL